MHLSDVEEGGETHLIRQDIKCKPKAGRLLMFLLIGHTPTSR